MTIPAGSNKGCVNFTIIDDNIAEEPDEQFEVTFALPNAAEAQLINVTDASSNVTIVDNDGKSGVHEYMAL